MWPPTPIPLGTGEFQFNLEHMLWPCITGCVIPEWLGRPLRAFYGCSLSNNTSPPVICMVTLNPWLSWLGVPLSVNFSDGVASLMFSSQAVIGVTSQEWWLVFVTGCFPNHLGDWRGTAPVGCAWGFFLRGLLRPPWHGWHHHIDLESRHHRRGESCSSPFLSFPTQLDVNICDVTLCYQNALASMLCLVSHNECFFLRQWC